jgi:hypothetical protein
VLKYNVETVGLHLNILTFLIHLSLVTFFYFMCGCFITICVGGEERCVQGFGFWWGNLRERDHLRYPDGRIILRWIFRCRGMDWIQLAEDTDR